MKGFTVVENPHFVGRQWERQRLAEIAPRPEATMIVVYGRRRIGKTELVEQFFRNEVILKFEGLEPSAQQRSRAAEAQQMQITNCLRRLSNYLENPLLAKVRCESWTEFFELIDDVAQSQRIVLYFEEIQWLANYDSRFFAELKPFWDDRWRHNNALRIVICGSSTSFIIEQLMSSRALYARAQEEFHLKELSLPEIREFLAGVGAKEALLAQLSVGGVCEYVKRLKGRGTVLTNLCRQTFLPSAFFSNEIDKIFVSSLSGRKHYRQVIEFLAKRKFASATAIAKAVTGSGQTGGSLTTILADLIGCGFVSAHTPLHKPETSKLVRYTIADEYLQYYFKFVKPLRKRIEQAAFVDNPLRALNRRSFDTALGFSFERWCRKNEALFARILGFSGVEYSAGAFYDKKSEALDRGFQIDLVYVIRGSKVVICEIKYSCVRVNPGLLRDVAGKVHLFQCAMPRYKNYTYETVLITAEGPLDNADVANTFDHVITLADIFSEKYW